MSLGIAVAVTVALARTAGWGVQFQSPTFLVVMALALTLFTAWVWGWWRLPLGFGSLGSSVGSSAGSSVAGSSPPLGRRSKSLQVLIGFLGGLLGDFVGDSLLSTILRHGSRICLDLKHGRHFAHLFCDGDRVCGSVAYLCRCATGSAIFAASWGVDGAAGTTLGLWSLAHLHSGLSACWMGAMAWMAVALLGMLLMLLRQENKRESRRESTRENNARTTGKVKRQAKAKPYRVEPSRA